MCVHTWYNAQFSRFVFISFYANTSWHPAPSKGLFGQYGIYLVKLAKKQAITLSCWHISQQKYCFNVDHVEKLIRWLHLKTIIEKRNKKWTFPHIFSKSRPFRVSLGWSPCVTADGEVPRKTVQENRIAAGISPRYLRYSPKYYLFFFLSLDS